MRAHRAATISLVTAAHFPAPRQPGAAGGRLQADAAEQGTDRRPSTGSQRGVIMTQDFEYNSYNDADRIAILESRAAELERRLLAFVPPDPATGWRNVVLPGGRQTEPEELPAAGDPDPDDLAGQPAEQPGALGPDGRTEALINHGRQRARRSRTRRVLAHWRMLLVGAVALLAGMIAALVALGGSSAAWPASVTT